MKSVLVDTDTVKEDTDDSIAVTSDPRLVKDLLGELDVRVDDDLVVGGEEGDDVPSYKNRLLINS